MKKRSSSGKRRTGTRKSVSNNKRKGRGGKRGGKRS